MTQTCLKITPTQQLKHRIQTKIREVFNERMTQQTYRVFQKENPSFPPLTVIVKTFGSWQRFCEEVFPMVTDLYHPATFEAFLYDHLEKPFTVKKYQQLRQQHPSLPHESWIVTTYGSWDACVEALHQPVASQFPTQLKMIFSDEFIEQLRQLSPRPLILSEYETLRKANPTLMSRTQIYRQYGSWSQLMALTYAEDMTKLSHETNRQQFIELLQQSFQEPFTIQEYQVFRQNSETQLPTSHYILKYYQTWRLFLSHVFPQYAHQMSFEGKRDFLFKELKTLSPHRLTSKQYQALQTQYPSLPSLSWIYKHWSSWEEFIHLVYGLDNASSQVISPSDPSFVEVFKNYYPSEITLSVYKKEHSSFSALPPAQDIVSAYGSWSAFIKQTYYSSLNPSTSVSSLSLIPSELDTYRLIRDYFKEPFTQSDYEGLRLFQPHLPSSHTLIKQYGEWTHFMFALFELKERVWTPESFISEIHRLVSYPIKLDDYKRLQQEHIELPSVLWITQTFGTWSRFLNVAFRAKKRQSSF